MIKKLKRTFILIMMGIVTLFLTVIFVTFYYSAKISFYQRSMASLHSGLMEKRMKNTPPGRPFERDELALFIVDVEEDGTIHVVKNRIFTIEDTEASALIARISETDSHSGTLADEHLRYLYERQFNGTTRYVFGDILQEQRALQWQILSSFLIGIPSLSLFFLLAVYLSKWAVNPVAQAWDQQRQFVADASHELKTPLTVILSNADMLIRSSTIPEGKNRQRIEHIQAEAVRMKELTESLLTLARSDSPQAAQEHLPLDLSYLVNSSIMTFEPLLFDAGKELVSQIQERILVKGDEKKLRQLTDILLDNARKYSRENSVITVRLTGGTKEALLTVTSEGTPLSKDEIKHIFLRFYRADPARSQIPGYGLGLPIAQSIVWEHKGRIEASSDGIKENTFSVRLPLCGSSAKPDESHL